MKNFRWALAGFVLGLLGAIAPSCGTKEKCDATHCPTGCCDASGLCVAGGTSLECGTGGAACQSCTTLQTCSVGACVPLGIPNDGGNGSDAGNAADAGSGADAGQGDGGVGCTGCTNATGTCLIGTADNACGAAGLACKACAATESCQEGVCVPQGSCNANTCPNGCCQNNTCVATDQQTNSGCGSGGAACVTCGGQQTCTGGTCTGGPACDSTSCPDGCCQAGVCITGNNQGIGRCGTSGASCVVCGPGESCHNGTCFACNATTCPTGCCQGNTCVDGTSQGNNACGAGGTACVTCGNQQVCSAGACTAKPQSPIGTPCATNGDCAAVGAGAVCRMHTQTDAGTYTGGYCTLLCDMTPCPTGATCIQFGAQFDESEAICLRDCAPPNSTSSPDCRNPGYACYGVQQGAPTGVCWLFPAPQVAVDAGPPSNKVGQACTTDTACQNPPGDGLCIGATLADGGSSGFPGGYCTAPCANDPAHCGTNGTCLEQEGFCLKSCPAPNAGKSNCRTNYLCTLNPDTLDGGVCLPNCSLTGCPQGSTCGSNGYCT